MTGPDLLGIADVAELAGTKEKTISAYLARHQMPAPDGRIGRTPYWKRKTIEAWLVTRASGSEPSRRSTSRHPG